MTQIVLPYTLEGGTPARADEVMDDLNAILDVVNGGLGSDNFGSGAGVVPVGAILDYGGAAAPSGFLLCDGTAYSRTTYAALFNVIGTTFGNGDGATTFNTPDYRGRVAMAPDGSAGRIGTASDTLGAVGGTERETLAASQIPDLSAAAAGAHGHGIYALGGVLSGQQFGYGLSNASDGLGVPVLDTSSPHGGVVTDTAANHTHVVNSGGGGSHNNLPPFQVAQKIIKV